jgi:amidophosphoribosyltransferase
MCGIFGYITTEGRGPDLGLLRHLAKVTETRGGHAFGLAWVNADGAVQTFKAPGPASEHLDELERCRDAVVLAGHCRWATHGSPEDNRNNHPHAAGTGFLVHNGVVENHRDLVRRYRLRPESRCDSEVLGLLMTRCGGSVNRRAAWTAKQAQGGLAMLGVWAAPARLLVTRRGRPLCFGRDSRGLYLASLPMGLPGRPVTVGDASSCVLVYRDGDLAFDGGVLPLESGVGPRRTALSASRRG